MEEELRVSRSEVERYRMEMAKNEENMRKALMRGVCALNMEAMSIFNENQLPFNQISAETQSGADVQKNNLFANCIPNLKTACSLTDLSISRKHQDEKELARKVKSYCETNLSTRNKSSDGHALSAVAKARLQLLNSNNKHSNDINPNVEQDIETCVPEQKFCSSNKIFDELTEHNLMITKVNDKFF